MTTLAIRYSGAMRLRSTSANSKAMASAASGTMWTRSLLDPAPPPDLLYPGSDLRGPEDDPFEDGEERGKEGKPGQQLDGDPDRERDPQAPVHAEGGEQETQQGENNGPGRRRDRLTDSFDRMHDRLPGLGASAKHQT